MRDARLLRVCLVAGLLCAASQAAHAQAPTTVQLPTFQFFTTTTSVLVPDRGATVLGGNRGRSLGTNFYSQPLLGPVRGSGSGTVAGQMQVHAQVHDLRAMDEALLGQAAGATQRGASSVRPPLLAAGNSQLSEVASSTADAPPAGSVADAVRARQAELAAADREARGFYEQGLKAEADGKPSLARAYYQMAAGKASESLRVEIRRRAASLPQSGSTPRTAQTSRP